MVISKNLSRWVHVANLQRRGLAPSLRRSIILL
jgi:hypothetical protein